jgi:hypothetical protein
VPTVSEALASGAPLLNPASAAEQQEKRRKDDHGHESE